MMKWLAHYEEDGAVLFRIGRDETDLVAEWLGLARLVARRDGSSHRIERDPNADPRELAKIERGSIQLLLRQLAGKMALHGAAISAGGKGVVFLGRTRQGKSTLAAALCTQNGVSLLSDDAVAVDAAQKRFVLVGLEEMHWLDAAARRAIFESGSFTERTDESDRDKRPIAAPSSTAHSELVAIVDLVFVEAPPRLVRVGALDAMSALVPQAVRFLLDDPAVNRRELEALGHMVDHVPMFRLERPRSLALLTKSCDLVHDLLLSFQTT
jgi:hypothetical protein